MKERGTLAKGSIRCILLLAVLSLITGIIYPLCITFAGRLFFPVQAGGSLLERNGAIIGSQLLGQAFSDNQYFHSRPSATDYTTLPSGGSNLTQVSLVLKDSVMERKKRFVSTNSVDTAQVPVEMMYASGSGLDPHISPGAAFLQMQRICKERGFDSSTCIRLHRLIREKTEGPQWLIFGDHRVNVLLLNLALDSLEVAHEQ